MFLGSVDDAVTRYPWTETTIDLAAFNRCLIFHALLGPKVCFRLGSIIYNERFLPALLQERSSPLIPLAKEGFVQIQCRAPGINASIASRLEIGTNSAVDFVKRKGWGPGTELFQNFATIEQELMRGQGMITYNPSFVSVFHHICDNLVPQEDTPFAEVYAQWRADFGPIERSRSNFETTAERVERDYGRRAQAMGVINSVNHYAYGIALRDADPGAAIETREIAGLQIATSTIFGQEERHVSADAVEDLIGNGAADIIVENFLIPERLLTDPELWNRFAPLTNPDNNATSREIVELKHLFLGALARAVSDNTNEERRRALRNTCRAYSAALNSALGTNALQQVPLRLSLCIRKACVVGVFLAAGMAGTAAVEDQTLAKIAVEVVLGFTANGLEPAILRSIDQFRTAPEAAAVITKNDMRGPFQGLSVRRIDLSSSEVLAKASGTDRQA